jgi:hypothetical protein
MLVIATQRRRDHGMWQMFLAMDRTCGSQQWCLTCAHQVCRAQRHHSRTRVPRCSKTMHHHGQNWKCWSQSSRPLWGVRKEIWRRDLPRHIPSNEHLESRTPFVCISSATTPHGVHTVKRSALDLQRMAYIMQPQSAAQHPSLSQLLDCVRESSYCRNCGNLMIAFKNAVACVTTAAETRSKTSDWGFRILVIVRTPWDIVCRSLQHTSALLTGIAVGLRMDCHCPLFSVT